MTLMAHVLLPENVGDSPLMSPQTPHPDPPLVMLLLLNVPECPPFSASSDHKNVQFSRQTHSTGTPTLPVQDVHDELLLCLRCGISALMPVESPEAAPGTSPREKTEKMKSLVQHQLRQDEDMKRRLDEHGGRNEPQVSRSGAGKTILPG